MFKYLNAINYLIKFNLLLLIIKINYCNFVNYKLREPETVENNANAGKLRAEISTSLQLNNYFKN